MFALDVGTFVTWMFVYLLIGLALLGIALGIGYLVAHRFPNRKLLTRLAVGVGATAMIVPTAATVIYTQLVNDPAPKFDTDDLANLVGGGSAATTSAGLLVDASLLTTSAVASADAAIDDTEAEDSAASSTECPATDSSAPTESAAGDGELDGTWVITDDSEFGYRVEEILQGTAATATGRGTEIEGSLTVAGTEITDACFVVQVASITSDQSMRDSQFNGRIMETSEYPTATFVLTEPITLEASPEVGGDPITAEATGELTMHGVTQTVTFEVTAQAGETAAGLIVGVLGEIPIVFTDYGIDDPSGGMAEVGEDGTLEFLLAFEPA